MRNAYYFKLHVDYKAYYCFFFCKNMYLPINRSWSRRKGWVTGSSARASSCPSSEGGLWLSFGGNIWLSSGGDIWLYLEVSILISAGFCVSLSK
jgi:hypothetical protein